MNHTCWKTKNRGNLTLRKCCRRNNRPTQMFLQGETEFLLKNVMLSDSNVASVVLQRGIDVHEWDY